MNVSMNCYPHGKHKAITLSYDDGTVHDRRFVELCNRYGLRGTFHLNSGKLDSPDYISASEVASLFAGHEVSGHTKNHPHLPWVSKERMAMEVLEDRKELERLAGYPVTGFSYPFGTYNETVAEALKAIGIEYARLTKSHGAFHLPEDFLRWEPTLHHRENLLEKTREYVDYNRKDRLSLLYVWGHSYEFDRNNNWELFEQFGELAGGLDDIWYATNIEIARYVQALKRLVFSVDGSLIYNPSAISVWVSAGGQAVELAPGTTKLG